MIYELSVIKRVQKKSFCLNPYFNGKWFMSGCAPTFKIKLYACLNPYFNGKWFMSGRKNKSCRGQKGRLNPYFNGKWFMRAVCFYSCISATYHTYHFLFSKKWCKISADFCGCKGSENFQYIKELFYEFKKTAYYVFSLSSLHLLFYQLFSLTANNR